MAKVIGIDLGTTNSCVAIMDGKIIDDTYSYKDLVGYLATDKKTYPLEKVYLIDNFLEQRNNLENYYKPINGTYAVKNIADVCSFDENLLKKISIALDIKDNQIASHGWKKTNDQSLTDIVDKYNQCPINSYFVTDVTNDGMLSGLNMKIFESAWF